MGGAIELPLPTIETTGETESADKRDPGFVVICWDDPINLIPYVTHVFQTVFSWDRDKALKHTMEVHEKGRSTLVREGFEKAEYYVHQLQKYSLQATMEPAE
jgi:ATP-dependent Clp protease adaptor protein ClpS